MPYPHATGAPRQAGPIPVRPSQVETIVSVHDVVAPIVERAQQLGPLPAVDSQEFLDAPRHVKVAVLLVAGAAWVLENPRAEHRRAMVEASHAIAAELPPGWADNYASFAELQARRAVPSTIVVGADGRAQSVRQGAA